MSPSHKPLVWLHGEVTTPPLAKAARIQAGFLLRLLQAGQSLGMPHSRPMPTIGKACHELRIPDGESTWRIFYRIDEDAIVLCEVLQKKTGKTPKRTIEVVKSRLREYDNASK